MATVISKIIDGPSKWDLMLSLLDQVGSVRRGVEFRCESTDLKGYLEHHGEMKVVINELSREDGSGESWNFKGFLMGHLGPVGEVSGFFSTKRRVGNMSIEFRD